MYAFRLDAARVELLVIDLPELWRQVSHELADFAQFLDQLTDANSERP